MSIVKGSLPLIGFTFLLWLVAGQAYAQAEPISPPDYSLLNEALENVHAREMNGGGNLSTSCIITATSFCLGTYEWNDNHQFDASDHKGAIQRDGYVQQNVSENSLLLGLQNRSGSDRWNDRWIILASSLFYLYQS
jgi:hypothetical protein